MAIERRNMKKQTNKDLGKRIKKALKEQRDNKLFTEV